MEFVCEDLPESGVVLIPSSSPEYGPLLADIRWRTDDPVEGSPPFPRKQIAEEDRELSAILVNRSQFGIAAVQQEWRFHKADFPGFDGLTPTYRSIFGPGANPSVLLPFGLLPKQLKLYGYWHVILPGSKHYLSPAGELIGDNSDVRPPEPDEVWTGGGVRWGGAGGDRSYAAVEKVTLTLDGVFFTDGTFIGPNRYQLWEQVTGRAAAYAQLIRISSDGGTRENRLGTFSPISKP